MTREQLKYWKRERIKCVIALFVLIPCALALVEAIFTK